MKCFLSVSVFLFLICIAPIGFANEAAEAAAEANAKACHDKASEDVTYAQQDIKALYFQNMQIIELLKDIKAALREKHGNIQ